MGKSIAKTMNEQMLEIRDKYLASGGSAPIDLDELARFAINNGEWKKRPSTLVQLCKRDFSRAFREQYHTDPQGRELRTNHAVMSRSGDKQTVFWDDMRSASPEHMQLAITQRRNHIVGDCVQLKKVVDSYNDNNEHGAFIQSEFNFSDDIAEREQPAEYIAVVQE